MNKCDILLQICIVTLSLTHYSSATKLKWDPYFTQERIGELIDTPEKAVHVVLENGKFSIKDGLDPSSIAWGTFTDTLNITGWGVLDLVGNDQKSKFDQNDVYYAVGMIEGYLSATRIKQNARTMHEYWNLGDKEPKIKQFFADQWNWANSQVTENKKDPYWENVGFILSQFSGLVDGCSMTDEDISIWDLQLLNGVGDLIDLTRALFPQDRPEVQKMNFTEFQTLKHENGHCSALVRVLPGYEDMFMGHSSWFYYGATNRIFKHYQFQLTNNDSIAASKVSFSSYAGYLESLDDFYVMNSGLVMLQTTINCLNHTLYQYVEPSSLLSWQRVRVANQMAKNGPEWGDYSMRYNSGTYNNQYMVIDTNLFTIGEPLKDNTLTVVEQMPNNVAVGDQTDYLRMGGYWPSYNVPFYKSIYDISGNKAAADKFGPIESYELCPRAKIFRRDGPKVSSFQDYKDILRYNNYVDDKYSDNNPWNAICSRGDLSNSPQPSGCYDTKVTHYQAARDMKAWALNGPTTSHNLPPFNWADFKDSPHYGLPETFANRFIEMKSNF